MMNFSGILIGVLTFFLIGLFHPIVIYNNPLIRIQDLLSFH